MRRTLLAIIPLHRDPMAHNDRTFPDLLAIQLAPDSALEGGGE